MSRPMPDTEGVVRHIQHAEEWLQWARIDYRRGDPRAGVLRLLLAEAEIRHAREIGAHLAAAAHDSPRPRRRRRMAVVGAAVALVLAAAAYTAVRPGGRYGPVAVERFSHASRDTEPAAPAGAVRLESGRLLTLGTTLADGGQDQSAGPPGRGEFRPLLFHIHGDGAGALLPAPADLTLRDGSVDLTTSGDPGRSSPSF